MLYVFVPFMHRYTYNKKKVILFVVQKKYNHERCIGTDAISILDLHIIIEWAFVGDAHKNNDARAQIFKRMPYKLRGHKLTVYM